MLRGLITHRTLGLSLGIVLVASGYALADEPPVKKPDSQSDLTEGLMDLLREPAKDKSPNQSNAQPGNPSQTTSPSNAAPSAGEDIGKGPSNPLAEVELGMSTLAGWLRGQPDASRTKQLQRDVVLRLDEMIGQLENQSASPSNSSSSASPNSSSQRQSSSAAPNDPRSASSAGNQPQPSNRQAPGNSQQLNPAGQSSSAESSGDQPPQSQGSSSSQPGQSSGGNDPQQAQGQPGVSPIGPRTVNVDLNDPRALQRSAWGNLPERMREQMQSRMVERFLPPYRDEIEAYYRALVK